jgi:hypothetical protein
MIRDRLGENDVEASPLDGNPHTTAENDKGQVVVLELTADRQELATRLIGGAMASGSGCRSTPGEAS